MVLRGDNPLVELKFDIAVLKLRKPIPLSRRPYYFKKVRIQEPGDKINWNSNNFRVAGWGKQVQGPRSEEEWPILHHITIARAPCPEEIQYLPGRTYCVGDSDHTTCDMDSGGPLIVKLDGTNEEIVAGLVTYGTQNCE